MTPDHQTDRQAHLNRRQQEVPANLPIEGVLLIIIPYSDSLTIVIGIAFLVLFLLSESL